MTWGALWRALWGDITEKVLGSKDSNRSSRSFDPIGYIEAVERFPVCSIADCRIVHASVSSTEADGATKYANDGSFSRPPELVRTV